MGELRGHERSSGFVREKGISELCVACGLAFIRHHYLAQVDRSFCDSNPLGATPSQAVNGHHVLYRMHDIYDALRSLNLDAIQYMSVAHCLRVAGNRRLNLKASWKAIMMRRFDVIVETCSSRSGISRNRATELAYVVIPSCGPSVSPWLCLRRYGVSSRGSHIPVSNLAPSFVLFLPRVADLRVQYHARYLA